MSDSPRSTGRICGVVVTYNPDLDNVIAQLDRLGVQLGRVLIVDNGSQPEARARLEAAAAAFRSVEIVALERNLGVAAAQNAGIRIALERGYPFVLLLDHDSLPATDMAARLLAAFEELSAGGAHIAAVGPRCVQRRTGSDTFFVRLGLLRFERVYCRRPGERVPTDFLISSGSLLAADALRDVGPMREDLFIDHVDTEWCLRARARGWLTYGVCDAVMEHEIGVRHAIPWIGGHREFSFHSPVRHYYTFRNSVYLYTRTSYPVRWKFSDAKRLAGMFVLFGFVFSGRLTHLRMMLLGAWDGLRGRLGPFEASRLRETAR